MIDRSIPAPGTEGERAIVKVESRSRPGHLHFVSADLEHCSCEATVLCRHIRIARIRAARRRIVPCMGCGAKHERRDMVELSEGEHDGLTFFDGDVVCEACAAEVA